MASVNLASSCKACFLTSVKAAPLALIAIPLVPRLWYEISSRWFHHYCPGPAVPRDIPFTWTFAVHQNEQINQKKLLQTIKKAVQKICGKDVEITNSSSSVSENQGSPTNFKLLPEPASGIKTVAYQCSVHGTEEAVEQAVRDEVVTTGKSLKEEKIHQNCAIGVERSLYECDPTISLKCILGTDWRDLHHHINYDRPARFLKWTHSEYSWSGGCYNSQDPIRCYNNKGAFQLNTPIVIVDADSPAEIVDRRCNRMFVHVWGSMVTPIVEKIKLAIQWNKVQEFLEVQYCHEIMKEKGFDIFGERSFGERRRCARILEEWFRKIEEEAKKRSGEKALNTLSSPALELIKKYLPEGKVPVAEDLYSFFGLEKGASIDEIKAAYRKITLNIHPDKQPKEHSKIAGEAYLFIRNAYEQLQKELQGS